MLPDSTVRDPKKGSSSSKKRRSSGLGDDTDGTQAKKTKKKTEKRVKKPIKKKATVKRRSDEDDISPADIDLSVPLYPISHFIRDRKVMVEQMFSALSKQKLMSMLPDILQKYSLKDLQSFCCDQVEVMSKKRIMALLDGQKNDEISSSGTEDEDDEMSSGCEEIGAPSKPGRSAAPDSTSADVESELNQIKPKSITLAMGISDDTVDLSKLEILELEMRARAIKRMLDSQPNTTDEDDAALGIVKMNEDDDIVIIKQEPRQPHTRKKGKKRRKYLHKRSSPSDSAEAVPDAAEESDTPPNSNRSVDNEEIIENPSDSAVGGDDNEVNASPKDEMGSNTEEANATNNDANEREAVESIDGGKETEVANNMTEHAKRTEKTTPDTQDEISSDQIHHSGVKLGVEVANELEFNPDLVSDGSGIAENKYVNEMIPSPTSIQSRTTGSPENQRSLVVRATTDELNEKPIKSDLVDKTKLKEFKEASKNINLVLDRDLNALCGTLHHLHPSQDSGLQNQAEETDGSCLIYSQTDAVTSVTEVVSYANQLLAADPADDNNEDQASIDTADTIISNSGELDKPSDALSLTDPPSTDSTEVGKSPLVGPSAAVRDPAAAEDPDSGGGENTTPADDANPTTTEEFTTKPNTSNEPVLAEPEAASQSVEVCQSESGGEGGGVGTEDVAHTGNKDGADRGRTTPVDDVCVTSDSVLRSKESIVTDHKSVEDIPKTEVGCTLPVTDSVLPEGADIKKDTVAAPGSTSKEIENELKPSFSNSVLQVLATEEDLLFEGECSPHRTEIKSDNEGKATTTWELPPRRSQTPEVTAQRYRFTTSGKPVKSNRMRTAEESRSAATTTCSKSHKQNTESRQKDLNTPDSKLTKSAYHMDSKTRGSQHTALPDRKESSTRNNNRTKTPDRKEHSTRSNTHTRTPNSKDSSKRERKQVKSPDYTVRDRKRVKSPDHKSRLSRSTRERKTDSHREDNSEFKSFEERSRISVRHDRHSSSRYRERSQSPQYQTLSERFSRQNSSYKSAPYHSRQHSSSEKQSDHSRTSEKRSDRANDRSSRMKSTDCQQSLVIERPRSSGKVKTYESEPAGEVYHISSADNRSKSPVRFPSPDLDIMEVLPPKKKTPPLVVLIDSD